MAKKPRGICTIKDCGRSHKAHGYCGSHYAQYKRHGKVVHQRITLHHHKPSHCTEPGCSKPVASRGLCGMHWARIKRSGASFVDLAEPPMKRSCSFVGCGDSYYSSGFCRRHHQRAAIYRREFKLSREEILEVFRKSRGRCEICNEFPPKSYATELSLDHDHKTGKVRGIICERCNHGIGHFKDNPKLLRAAAAYLDKHLE